MSTSGYADRLPIESSAPPQTSFTEVDLAPSGGFWPVLMGALAGGLVFGVAFSVRAAWAWGFAAGTCALLMLGMWAARHRLRRRVYAKVQQNAHEPVETLVRRTFEGRSRLGAWGLIRVTHMVRFLAEAGRRGATIRIAPADKRSDIDPIDFPFEPQPINEADPNFSDLEAASHNTGTKPSSQDSSWLGIKRSVALRGGWIVAAMFGFNVVLYAWLSYVERRIKPELIMWGALFALTLFGTAGAWKSAKQWLAVPGGLLRRKTGLFERGWQLDLFAAAGSVLVLVASRRGQWLMCIGKGSTFDRAVLTPREAQFVLRAWLSPMPPPEVERLTDLS